MTHLKKTGKWVLTFRGGA